MLRLPPTRSMSAQRRARSCPRRAPVVAAKVRWRWREGSRATNSRSCATCPGVGGRISAGSSLGGSRVVCDVLEYPGPSLRLAKRRMK
jgi:hypothetical protein